MGSLYLYTADCDSVRASSSAENVGRLGCTDPLQDFQRLPQLVLRRGGVADGQGAPAQAR